MGIAAQVLSMRPRDWDLLTVEETDHLLDYLDEYVAALEKAAAQSKSKR